MIRKLLILLLLKIFFIIMPFYFEDNTPQAFAAESIKINSINFDNSDSIIFLGTSKSEDFDNVKITKKQLSSPERIFFDIENAVITFPNSSYSIKNSKLKQLKIAQNSIQPDIVRIVIWNSSNYNSEQIKVLKFKNNIIIKLNNEIPSQQYLTQIYRESDESAADYYDKTFVIPEVQSASDEIFKKVQQAFKEDESELVRPNIEQTQARLKSRYFLDKVTVQNGNLFISGIGVLNVKKPMILSEPSRIVYDLPNTIVLQELRDKEFKLSENSTAKIGQFEASTARIVIKTDNIDNYIPIYSENLQSLIIANNNNLGTINYGIKLSKLTYFKEQNVNLSTNIINITFSDPIVYSLKRIGSKMIITFYNLTEFDTTAFNTTAENNKTGFKAKQNGKNTYQISFPAQSGVLIDCYEALNASQLRFVFTKAKSTVQKKTIEEKSQTFSEEKSVPSVIPYPHQLKKEDIKESIKDKKPEVKDSKKKKRTKQKETSYIDKIKTKVIVIDPGHGGNDTGALRCGILEKNITLDIALKVRDILKEKGFTNIIMTRTTDKTLSLAERVETANSNSADIYVSIHINASVKSEINGIETHYYSEKGYDAAKIMHKELMSKISAADRGLFKSKFYVINHTEAPAVLLELGFISNEKERNSLISQTRQTASAQAIADGIVKYLTEY